MEKIKFRFRCIVRPHLCFKKKEEEGRKGKKSKRECLGKAWEEGTPSN